MSALTRIGTTLGERNKVSLRGDYATGEMELVYSR